MDDSKHLMTLERCRAGSDGKGISRRLWWSSVRRFSIYLASLLSDERAQIIALIGGRHRMLLRYVGISLLIGTVAMTVGCTSDNKPMVPEWSTNSLSDSESAKTRS